MSKISTKALTKLQKHTGPNDPWVNDAKPTNKEQQMCVFNTETTV